MNRVFLLIFTTVVFSGCSSSDNNSVPDNGGDGDGVGGSDVTLLGGIATTDASSQPALLDIEAVQNTLDSITATDPVAVTADDTVESLLQKVGL